MTPLAISLPGALAALLVAVAGFAVVIAVSFVILRLISFVVGPDEPEPAAGPDPPASAATDSAEATEPHTPGE